MSAKKTTDNIDALIAQLEDHWPSPCCGKWWYVAGKRNPHPVECCGQRYEVNTDSRTWA